jgi:hypothetical protein
MNAPKADLEMTLRKTYSDLVFRRLASFVILVLVLLLSCGASRTKAEASVRHESPRAPIPVYGVLELSFQHNTSYENPFWAVSFWRSLALFGIRSSGYFEG